MIRTELSRNHRTMHRSSTGHTEIVCNVWKNMRLIKKSHGRKTERGDNTENTHAYYEENTESYGNTKKYSERIKK